LLFYSCQYFPAERITLKSFEGRYYVTPKSVCLSLIVASFDRTAARSERNMAPHETLFIQLSASFSRNRL
jgi:hypothetical protein